jgi:hypothetical protein
VASDHLHTHSYDPKTLSALYAAFDRAWKLVEIETDARYREAARYKIAVAIMGLAREGEADIERLAAHAVARTRHPTVRIQLVRRQA